MNQLKAGVILSYITLGLSNIIGLVYTPFMLRMMGQSEYGLYSLVASVVAYLTVFDFGFGNAIIRYTAKFRAEGKIDEQYSMFGMFLLLYLGIGILTFLAGLGLYFNVDTLFANTMSFEELDKAQLMILLLVFNLAVTFPLSIFGSIITAYEDFIFQKIVNIIRIILNPIVMVILLLIGYRALGMVVVTSVFNIITLLINWWYCKYKLKIRINFGFCDWSLLKEISGFSFFVFMKLILDKVYWSTGQFVVGVYAGTIAVAVYAIAMQMRNYYLAFSCGLTSVFLPRLTAMVANRATVSEISDLFIRISRLQCHIVGLIMAGFILFGKSFIILWAGLDYSDSYIISLIIMIPFTIPLIQTLGHSLIQAYDMQKIQFYVYLLIAFLTLVLSIPLVRLFNGVGAAVSVSTAIIIGEVFVMNWFYYKKMQIDILRFWMEMSKIILPIIIFTSLFSLFKLKFQIDDIQSLLIIVLIFMILYFPYIYYFGFNQYEKSIFESFIDKLKLKFLIYFKCKC